MVSLRQLAFAFSDIGAGAFNHAARLLQSQHVGAAGHQLLLYEAVRLLIISQRLFGNGQLRGQAALIKIGLRNVGHHHNLRGALGRLAGEYVLPVGFAHVFQLAEKVQLVAQVQPYVIAFIRGVAALQVAFIARAGGAIQLRIAPGIGHVVLCTRGFNVEHRHTQIAVVTERNVD